MTFPFSFALIQVKVPPVPSQYRANLTSKTAGQENYSDSWRNFVWKYREKADNPLFYRPYAILVKKSRVLSAGRLPLDQTAGSNLDRQEELAEVSSLNKMATADC